MTITVAGGSFTEPTIAEKEFTGQQVLKTDLLSNAVYETAISSRIDESIFNLHSSASDISTSSVEKYVLNAAFLI
jgi:hypothetical protein